MAQLLVLQRCIINIVLLVAELHELVEEYTFNCLWQLVSKFHFLVALEPEYIGTKILSSVTAIRIFSSVTAISSRSNVCAHIYGLWELTCTKGQVASVWSTFRILVAPVLNLQCAACARMIREHHDVMR